MKKIACCLALLTGCVVSAKDDVGETEIAAVTDAAHDGFGPFRGDFGVCDDDTAGWLDADHPYQFWSFETDGCDETFIDVASRDGDDLYMLLYRQIGGSWRLVHRNDDCRGSLNSCYEGALTAGTYLVGVTTYEYMRYREGVEATYIVNVHCDNDEACGTLGQTCGGFRGGTACDEGQFCDIPMENMCGRADGPGVCAEIPDVCAEVYQPVCGCNDHTYGNACEAASNGVSVDHEGTCGTLGDSCGSRGMAPCEEGQFCNFPVSSMCGRTDLPGVCEETPDSCMFRRLWFPVCGCDGRDYDDACFAAQHGISVESEGVCNPPAAQGEECAGLAGVMCAEGLYCDRSGHVTCGADLQGECRPEELRFCPAVYMPECGCDGVTYSNGCARGNAGVPLDHAGVCGREGQAEGELCGGIAGLLCNEGLHCEIDFPAGCGGADFAGVCREDRVVFECPAVYDQVCACSGRTYWNGCQLERAGERFDHDGAC